MSLINDALKRASLKQKQDSGQSPPTAGLEPVQGGQGDGGSRLKLLIVVVAVAVVGVGGWFIWKALKPAPKQQVALAKKTNQPAPAVKSGTNVVAKTNVPPATSAVARAVIAPLEKAKATLATLPKAPPEETKVEEPAAAQSPPTTVAEKPPSPLPRPTLNLQAIVFRLKNPAVRINGKTLLVGDEVDGAKVVEILRESTKVEFAGETTVLTLKKP